MTKFWMALGLCVTLTAGLTATTGCSTLGISLYPSASTPTEQTEALLAATRVPTTVPRERAKTVLPLHRLSPGDAVVIEALTLRRDLQIPADQRVLADGTVDLGACGRCVVAGQTLEGAESLIENQVRGHLERQSVACNEKPPVAGVDLDDPPRCDSIVINVRLLDPIHRYYVLGEVNAPGGYPLVGHETVLDAIVDAGGLTDSADACGILLARPTDPYDCRVTLPVCYRQITQQGNTATNYQLRPGDRIFVGSRSCIDELCFWKAGDDCEKCCGCPRACGDPAHVSVAAVVPPAILNIAPGSTGTLRLAGEVADAGTGMVERDSPSAGAAAGGVELNAPQTLPVPEGQAGGFDGELNFTD